MPCLPSNHVQLDFPKRAALYFRRCLLRHKIRYPTVTCVRARRSGRHRPQHLHFLGIAYLLAGKYETAAALLRDRILLVPGTDFSRVLLASALGHLGEGDEARRIWQRTQRQINPKYSFSEHFARQPFKREDDVQRIAEGLAKAGLST